MARPVCRNKQCDLRPNLQNNNERSRGCVVGYFKEGRVSSNINTLKYIKRVCKLKLTMH